MYRQTVQVQKDRPQSMNPGGLSRQYENQSKLRVKLSNNQKNCLVRQKDYLGSSSKSLGSEADCLIRRADRLDW